MAVRTKHGRVIIDFAFITFLAVVIFRNFLFTNEWPAGGDVLGWISRSYLFGKDFRWLHVWHPYSFGFVEGINSLDFFLALIYVVCHDSPCAIKIFMFSSFLTAGFSMYAFAYRYTRKHIAALSASMIYTLNQWVFSQFTEAHIDITFSYALAPLLFLLLDRALGTRKLRDILILALGLSVFVTGFHPECIIIYGIFLAIFVVFHTLLPKKAENFHTRVNNLLRVWLPVGVICFLLSAFSLIPFISNVKAHYYSPAYGYPLEATLDLSHKNVADAFTLMAVEDFGYRIMIDIPTDLSLPDLPVGALLLFLFFLAYCTIFLRRDRYTAFFLISTLISIFISKGPYPPFGYVFMWAWFNVPHFAVFRAASRWAMMTALSNAFFVSVLTGTIIDYIKKKRYLQMREIPLCLKAKVSSEHAQEKEIRFSLDFLNRISKKLHRFLHYFSLMMLILIFLSGLLSCWFFFIKGLQVYTPPPRYLEPYKWIAEQPGDYKIVTVSGVESDFASQSMATDVGWSHDIGYESFLIHDKPTLQNGGWEPLCGALVNYLRFRLVRENMTDDLLKILGTLNYKYVVLPPYASASARYFFLKQQGGRLVYNQSTEILENEFYIPRIFAATEHVVLVGGLESLFSLSKIDSLNFSETVPVFVHQMKEEPLSHSLFNSSKAIFFVNTDVLDLIMLSLKEDVSSINAAEYSMRSVNATKYWITCMESTDSWKAVEGLVFSGNTVLTSGQNSLNLPFAVETKGVYDIWIRIRAAPNRGKLTVSIDGVPEREIQPVSNLWSKFMWVNITRSYLGPGSHSITLSNDGTGYNNIDTIMIVEPSLFQQKTSEVLDSLQEFSGRFIYMLDAENVFTYNPRDWFSSQRPFEGIVLHTDGMTLNISPKGNASASSVSGGTTSQGAIDGSLKTRWASQSGLPAWLQINWTGPQELIGVRLFFEWAYAEDYTIQTWNGTNWVDQAKIEGNTLLERFHQFKQPVQTTKLRIYVTSAPVMNLASIWELESYTTEGVDAYANIFIPREGKYTLAARLASNASGGTLKVKINDFTTQISYSNSTGFEWYESHPFSLNAGDQTISISSAYEVDIDKIVVYSLEEGESAVPLSHLFTSGTNRPSINYEKVNPCKYVVHANSNEPFLLVLSEAYHPLWKAYINNVEVSPTNAYSCVNAFFINKTGEFDITLYFTGQTYADIGGRISLVTFLVVTAVLCVEPKRFRLLRDYVKRKKR